MINKKLYAALGCLLFSSSLSAATLGDPAPACTSSSISDKQVLDVANLKGKVVYMDFWASWCPPCKTSFPSLDRLYHEFKDQGFEVVAINLDEEKSDAEEFLQNNPVNFSIGYDGEGKCPRSFDVKAMPTSFIIDKKGIIREIHLGFDQDTPNKIRSTILTLLNE